MIPVPQPNLELKMSLATCLINLAPSRSFSRFASNVCNTAQVSIQWQVRKTTSVGSFGSLFLKTSIVPKFPDGPNNCSHPYNHWVFHVLLKTIQPLQHCPNRCCILTPSFRLSALITTFQINLAIGQLKNKCWIDSSSLQNWQKIELQNVILGKRST